MIGEFVLVRTRNAGVHCGELAEWSQQGTAIRLTNARRIWRWRGANTLNELSLHGAERAWTRISEPVESILLTEAIEIIPCTPKAKANLETSRWGA